MCIRDSGNVVGLMPHPEHAVEPGFGPDTAVAMRSGVDGLGFFTSVVKRTLVGGVTAPGTASRTASRRPSGSGRSLSGDPLDAGCEQE